MIHVTPLSRLDETLRRSGARNLLTLLSPGADFSIPGGHADLRWLGISMHDLAVPREGYVVPSEEHVAAIIAFGSDWDRGAPLVIHCHAGISRSTAAAYVIAAALRPDRDEAGLARELRARAPSATPNPLIVAHADRLLNRKGRMIKAIGDIGRGAEAFEGTPFRLDLE
jgi:predicted protein tyrosine phosphatase